MGEITKTTRLALHNQTEIVISPGCVVVECVATMSVEIGLSIVHVHLDEAQRRQLIETLSGGDTVRQLIQALYGGDAVRHALQRVADLCYEDAPNTLSIVNQVAAELRVTLKLP